MKKVWIIITPIFPINFNNNGKMSLNKNNFWNEIVTIHRTHLMNYLYRKKPRTIINSSIKKTNPQIPNSNSKVEPKTETEKSKGLESRETTALVQGRACIRQNCRQSFDPPATVAIQIRNVKNGAYPYTRRPTRRKYWPVDRHDQRGPFWKQAKWTEGARPIEQTTLTRLKRMLDILP